MPRIRTIKPEFWGDEKLAPMAPIDRLVFLGLLSFADDAGRLLDNVKAIDGFIFPESEQSSRDSLARLAANGRLLRYESESGQRLIQVVNWRKHQKIDHPSKYVLPSPSRRSPRESRESDAESLAKSSRLDLGPTTSTSTSTSTEDLKAPRKDLGTPRAPEDDPPPASNASLASPFAALRDLSHDAPAVAEFVRRFYPRASTAAERRTSVATQLLATLNGGATLKGQRVVAYSLDRLTAKCREVIDEGVRDPDKAIVVLLTKLADTSDGAAPGAIAAAAVERERVQTDAERARELVDANAWLEEHPDVETAIHAQLERDGFPAELPPDDVRIIGRRIARESLVLTAYRRRAPDPASAPVETA